MRFGVQAVFLNKRMGIMLELRQICKRFGSRIVAENISFTAAAGEITAVLGASGSGKSTLLNMVAGLVLPDSGEVCLNGVVLNGITPENRRVAMMFQDFALLPHLDVRDNAALPLRLRGMGKHEARDNVLKRCWQRWVWRIWCGGRCSRCRVGNSSAPLWHGLCWQNLRYCCWTSRFRH